MLEILAIGDGRVGEGRPDLPCRTVDPDLFFPEGRGGARDAQAAKAKALCLACHVRTTCLEDATAHREPWGIWGGVDLQRPEPRSAGKRTRAVA